MVLLHSEEVRIMITNSFSSLPNSFLRMLQFLADLHPFHCSWKTFSIGSFLFRNTQNFTTVPITWSRNLSAEYDPYEAAKNFLQMIRCISSYRIYMPLIFLCLQFKFLCIFTLCLFQQDPLKICIHHKRQS